MEFTAADRKWVENTFEWLRANDFPFSANTCTKFMSWHACHEEDCLNYGVDINCGCSRIVFFPITEYPEFVVKFDINQDHASSPDFCGVEAQLYEKAVAANVSRFFAETIRGGEWEGITYYLQEYAPNDSEKLRERVIQGYIDDGADAAEYFANNGEDEPSVDAIWSYYSDMVDDMDSEEKVTDVLGCDDALLSFLSENQIDDLHFGNYGESERGWIIIDFCGYESAYSSFRATHPNCVRPYDE